MERSVERPIVNWVENTCLGVVTAAAATLLFEGALFLRAMRVDLEPVAAEAQASIAAANATLQNAAALEGKISAATDKFSAAADQETAYWQKTQAQVYKLITDSKEIMVRTDRSLNDGLVPRLETTLDGTTALQASAMKNLADTTAEIDATIAALRPAIDNSVTATAAAAKNLNDLAIHETLAHVDGASANVDAATADISAFVHRETTPVRGTWNVLKKFLQEFAGPAAQVATAVK
jgi:hypothetical protein